MKASMERTEEGERIVYKGSDTGTKVIVGIHAVLILFFQLIDYHASVLTCTSTRTRQLEGDTHAVVTQAECILTTQTLFGSLFHAKPKSTRFTTDEIQSVYVNLRSDNTGSENETTVYEVLYRIQGMADPLYHREFTYSYDAQDFVAQIEAYLTRIREPRSGESAPQVFEIVEDFKMDDVIFWILIVILFLVLIYAPTSETLVFDKTHFDFYYDRKNMLGLILARQTCEQEKTCPSRLKLESIVRFGELTEITEETDPEERRRNGNAGRSYSYIIVVVVRSVINPRDELTYKLLTRAKSGSTRELITATIQQLNQDLQRLQTHRGQNSPNAQIHGIDGAQNGNGAAYRGGANDDGADADRGICVICCTNAANMVLIPCGHITLCTQCAPAVNQCPLCRTICSQKQRVFFP